MTGAEKHRGAALGRCGETVREGVQCGQCALRIDHILAGDMLRIGFWVTEGGADPVAMPDPDLRRSPWDSL